jgi:hypothetical protein
VTLELGFLLAAGATLVTGAIAWGALKTQVGALREAITKLEASRDRLGERVGELEGRVRLLRHVTQARGVATSTKEDD